MRFFKIFLASPGDTDAERQAADRVVDEINKSIGSRDNFRLELLKWENDTYPSMGEDGQDVINNQIGRDYQIFVGIMWKKFGTPTKRAGSGTEEEFELAYDRFTNKKNVQIMFYFNSCPIPQDADLEEFQKVKAFKKKIKDLGAYHKQFASTEDFEKSLRMDLTCYVKDILKEEIQEAVISKPEEQRDVDPRLTQPELAVNLELIHGEKIIDSSYGFNQIQKFDKITDETISFIIFTIRNNSSDEISYTSPTIEFKAPSFFYKYDAIQIFQNNYEREPFKIKPNEEKKHALFGKFVNNIYMDFINDNIKEAFVETIQSKKYFVNEKQINEAKAYAKKIFDYMNITYSPKVI